MTDWSSKRVLIPLTGRGIMLADYLSSDEFLTTNSEVNAQIMAAIIAGHVAYGYKAPDTEDGEAFVKGLSND